MKKLLLTVAIVFALAPVVSRAQTPTPTTTAAPAAAPVPITDADIKNSAAPKPDDKAKGAAQ